MYVGLWSRVAAFQRDDLTRALEDRTVVQGTLLRSTIHLVSARDYWPFAIAIREPRRRWWLRYQKAGVTGGDMDAAASKLRARLAGGPLLARDIDAMLGKDVAHGIGLWVDMVRVPPSGTWERRRADMFASAEKWLGQPAVDTADAMDHLVRRYLGGFGPSSPAEIANWAGVNIGDVQPSLTRLRLRRHRADDGDELVDLPRAPLPDATVPAPVRFLPTWDATLLVHTRRAEVLAEQHRPLIFHTKNPQSVGTFLVDGSVAGTWRLVNRDIRVTPFEPLPAAIRQEVDAEAERLAQFHA